MEAIPMKSKRVQRDEKIIQSLIFLSLHDQKRNSNTQRMVEVEEVYDAILRRVRAMGPKDEHCDFGKLTKYHKDFDNGWNQCNWEWRRRLGGR